MAKEREGETLVLFFRDTRRARRLISATLATTLSRRKFKHRAKPSAILMPAFFFFVGSRVWALLHLLIVACIIRLVNITAFHLDR